MLVAVLTNNFIVLFIIIFGTVSYPKTIYAGTKLLRTLQEKSDVKHGTLFLQKENTSEINRPKN